MKGLIEGKSMNTSEMTYQERYQATTSWKARHLAKDLMEMNGPNEFITEHDDGLIAACEKSECAEAAEARNQAAFRETLHQTMNYFQ